MAKEEEKREPTLHDKYREGDIDLVSSDNVLFKVHKYQLMAAGAGFRDALTCPINSNEANQKSNAIELELVDKDIETSRVIGGFFDFLEIGTISMADVSALGLVRDVLRFARKWQCTAAVRILLDCARLSLLSEPESVDPSVYFRIGAEAEDIALCLTAIRNTGLWKWTGESKFVGGDRINCSVMDPTVWEEIDFECNPRYFWALTVASHNELGPSAQHDQARWKRIADKFEIVVKSKKSGMCSIHDSRRKMRRRCLSRVLDLPQSSS